jgi:hypothetical protein
MKPIAGLALFLALGALGRVVVIWTKWKLGVR